MIDLKLEENQESIDIKDNIEDIILTSEELDDCIIEINEFNKALTNTFAIRDVISSGIVSTESIKSIFGISLDELIALEAMSADKRVSLGKKLLNKLSSYLREIGNNKGAVIQKVREVKEYVSKNRSKLIKRSDNMYTIGLAYDEIKYFISTIQSTTKNINKDNVNDSIGRLNSLVRSICKAGEGRGYNFLHPTTIESNISLGRAYEYVDKYYFIYISAFSIMYDLQHILDTVDKKINTFDSNKADTKAILFNNFTTEKRTMLINIIAFVKKLVSASYVCLMKWCKAILATK